MKFRARSPRRPARGGLPERPGRVTREPLRAASDHARIELVRVRRTSTGELRRICWFWSRVARNLHGKAFALLSTAKGDTMTMTPRCAMALAAVTTAIIYALSSAPVASTYPGDPMPNCVSAGLFNAVLYCDGPIRPDGTWQRCWTSQPGYSPQGGWVGGGTNCEITDQSRLPLGLQPDHHIGN